MSDRFVNEDNIMMLKQIGVMLVSVMVLTCCGVTDTGSVPVQAVSADAETAENADDTSVSEPAQSDETAVSDDSTAVQTSDEEIVSEEVSAGSEESDTVEVEDESEGEETPEEEEKPAETVNPSVGNQSSNDDNRGCVGDEALVW